MTDAHSPTQAFRDARDLLLRHREDYPAALAEFSWPRLDEFNWALGWFDVIAAGHPAGTALAILGHTRQRLSPYKRIRRLEFSDVPKTISGKIRRVELRAQETERLGQPGAAGPGPAAPIGPRGHTEFWEEDFPGLKG